MADLSLKYNRIPMMGSMQALSIVIKKASAYSFVGSAVLNLLQSQLMAGNYLVRSLLEKMIDSANSAYLGILERWVYEGVIDDPHDEFFIAENKSLQKESLTQDYDAVYWRQRYSLKDDIPSFLANSAETILTTGKYLNVMRECGHTVQVPALENSKLTSFGSNDHYLECIKSAYDFASGELLNLMKDKYDLNGKLRSIKHYLLLDQGDFLVHFMDIARDELAKTPNEISVEKLQVLEPNWHVMHNKLENAKSIDEVIQYHDFFMAKCLKECLLLSPILLKKLEKLKLVCLQYAAATQWLMNSIEVPEDTDNPSYESCKVLLKLRKPSKTRRYGLDGLGGDEPPRRRHVGVAWRGWT
ncbi:putative gamma-tubulin complex component protein [Helianthus annuus]|nr:putative gamma-tubulin complex component protein [Helianthus annuus]